MYKDPEKQKLYVKSQPTFDISRSFENGLISAQNRDCGGSLEQSHCRGADQKPQCRFQQTELTSADP